jgi:crotonobetainyl-CoA:carnitine CoA-transferase CaiB-like acyl-CoA transferase
LSENYFSFTDQLFNQAKIPLKAEAFKGLRVLDLSRIIFGPVISRWLALYGAEVIKVEEPDEGDNWRVGTYWAKYSKDANPYFQSLNPNKYFIGIDLKKEKGKDLVLELAKKSDIVIENFRAGLTEAWGIGYTTVSQINPKVIYISCSGYGQWGPLRFFPSWDLIAQSMSGVARLTGFPGKEAYKLQDYYGDFLPGLFGVIAVLAALNYSKSHGKGQYIDMAQAEAIMRIMPNWTYMSATGQDLERTGNSDPCMAPSGIFKSSDGNFVSVAIATDDQFAGLVKAMGKPELLKDSRFNETLTRLQPENAAAISAILSDWVGGVTQKDLIELASLNEFPASRVANDYDLVKDDWRKERGSIVEINDEMYEKETCVIPAAMLEKSPARMKWMAKPLGYHNNYILKKLLGLSAKQIADLRKEEVVGYWDNRVGQKPPPYYDVSKDPIFNYREGDANDAR